jgi:ankyrin repeat protein
MHFGTAMMRAPMRSSRSIRNSWIVHLPRLCVRLPTRPRNNNIAAVRAMLRRGFPVTAMSQHGATPLHWAAFHGNSDMLENVLRHNPPINAQDRQIQGTRWAA